MRYTALLPFAAAAAAFVIPDEATAKELFIETEQKAEETLSSWWDRVPSVEDIRSHAEETLDDAYGAFERQASKLTTDLPATDIEPELSDFVSHSDYEKPGHGRHGHHGHHGHHGAENLTVYQVIHATNFTKKFAAMVDEYPEIVKALNSTEANVTAFVPTDKAFERIPDHHKKPPKEVIEKILEYHVIPGYYPAGRVLAHHTLPTLLKEEELGDRPQRLRASIGLFGARLNFYSKIVGANLFTKNGVIHCIDSILVPPPPADRLISLFPSRFSTLLLAAEKTGLHRKEGHVTKGLTIFAPTNWAFQKLGPGANAFLFNTEKGLKYLKALLKYHCVVNETLYSDEYYGKPDERDEVDAENAQYHVDLPTLLEGKHLSIDIARFYGMITMKINGYTKVSVQDAVAKDGVVHVLNSVLIPPHEHKGSWKEEDGELEVDELIERLQPFVEPEWVGELNHAVDAIASVGGDIVLYRRGKYKVVLFTGALFLSGYVVQQKTLNKLRAAVTQQMAPRPSPKINFYLPDRFRQSTTELEDGSVVDVAPDPDPDPDNIDIDDVLSGGNGERGKGGVVVEVRATMPEGADAKEEKGEDGESDGARKPRSAAAAGYETNAGEGEKPLSRAERRRRIKEEIQRLSQGDQPVYYQRRLW
ncbi:hypothetical protein DL765_008414 [Monosporascus sp. GIB2]|nr:hypothetical protein DL765_008414 [Monosporascus sp. GIB2]